MKKRSKLGSPEGGILQRFGRWVVGTKPPIVDQGYIRNRGNEVSQWSSSYDNTPLDGDVYVGGKCCRTVGEYKAAAAKFYDPY